MAEQHVKQRVCDPGICDHCIYICEGDFICDLYGMGPDKTTFVLEDWQPTEDFLQCMKGRAQDA